MQLYRHKLLIITLFSVGLYIFSFLFLDRSVDLWVHHTIAGTAIEKGGKIVSQFASGAYMKLFLTCGFLWIALTDPRLQKTATKKLFYLLISVSIAIIVGDGLKYFLGRYRPVMLFEHNLYGLHFFSTHWDMNSSPSGHTVRAFSFFAALALLFKRFSPLFFFAALAIGISRVIVTAHYPSDVLFGAYIGTMTAILVHKIVLEKKTMLFSS
jgi:membrane-associated phospholipid phosphatase